MQPLALSDEGHALAKGLEAARHHSLPKSTDVLHISGVGGNLYFAYEQLRNAAEYSERHLLLRRAIERFLYRNLNLRGHLEPMGKELVAELTQSRYLQNDTIPRVTAKRIDDIIERYVHLATAVRSAHSVSADKLTPWIFQSASVELEHQLVEHALTDAYMDFAYEHFLGHIDRGSFEEVDDATYSVALHCAVQRTLFKSDVATIRYYAVAARLGFQGGDSLAYFVHVNQAVDDMSQSPLTNKVSRLINRNGAPLRILREVFITSGEPTQLLSNRAELMSKIDAESQRQYRLTRKRLNDGIVRSVAFIFITKVLLGLSIEVPYDLITLGAIAWVPLLINTMFAPVYMATIGWGIRTPGKRNTEVIQSYINRIAYGTDDPPLTYKVRKRVSSSTLNGVFNTIYTVAFLVSFGVVVYVLQQIGFNVVNGAIFFVFLSVVSFFGFRLLQSARELEIVDHSKSLISVLFDFFYTPFIRVGNWLSDRYSRLNIVTFVLDMAIELPLKTVLRVVQQWVGFIRDKQEEL